MQLIQNLDYQGAMAEFEEAEAANENERLLYRGRGIAYMGLTDYEQAISCFQTALAASSGIVESVDFDLNYYLAAAYTKNGQYQEQKIPTTLYLPFGQRRRMPIFCGETLF